MAPRFKKLIGLGLLLVGLALYIAAAIVIADFVPAFWPAKLLYFAGAGVAWAFPAKYLINWVNRDSTEGGD